MTEREINKQRMAEGKPPLNFKLIRKVIKRIETKPETYAQQVWGQRADAFNKDAKEYLGGRVRPIPSCGTVACLAGETVICGAPTLKLGLLRVKRRGVLGRAQKLLGLTYAETHLFDGDGVNWLKPFRLQFENAKSYRGEARAAVNYLKHILRTGKVIND
jgi:hypothetical protein